MAVSKSYEIRDNSVDPEIYIRTSLKPKRDPCHNEWYQIRGDSTTPEHKILSPQLTPVPLHLKWSACTTIGSKIYVTGGCVRHWDSSKEVYYIDACNQSDGWKKASPIKAARWSHYAFNHDGQMYVIGGENGSDEPWAEVYDPTRDTWHALPMIPKDVLRQRIAGHAVVSGGGENGYGKRILLHPEHSGEVYYYDFELELLGVSSANISNDSIRPDSSQASSSFAFLDGILYYFGNWDKLYAYDISKPNSAYTTVMVPPELKVLLAPDTRYGEWNQFCLLSLGNEKLAVITSNESHNDKYGYFVHVRCTKLHMLKKVVNDKKGTHEIEAKLINQSNYYLRGELVDSCLTIAQEGASPNTRVWAQDEDLKLIEALHISQIATKHYRAGDGFDDKTHSYDLVEKILNITLPESKLKADPHIETRTTTLKRKFEIVDEMIQRRRGFEYDDSSKRVVADLFVWESLKSDDEITEFKDIRFPWYRELCSVFRNDQEPIKDDNIK